MLVDDPLPLDDYGVEPAHVAPPPMLHPIIIEWERVDQLARPGIVLTCTVVDHMQRHCNSHCYCIIIHRASIVRVTATGQDGSRQVLQVHRPVACAGGRVIQTSATRPTAPSAPRRTLILQCNPDTLLAVRRSIDPNMPSSYD